MTAVPVSEILLGVYLGLLAGIFPAFIAFTIGFGFKYFTSITVPGLGVVALGGALAGVSGGLMGVLDPELSESWTGIVAVLVILMACLWAHGQGDKLGGSIPRALTLKSIREAKLSADIVERVDSYGQIRLQPVGEVHDIEGYPPLPDDLRERLTSGSWKFPANLALAELESRLEERLMNDYELAEVSVSIDSKGRVQLAAAPSAAGLSRRVSPGERAVTIQTLLPTGVARGDVITVQLPDTNVTGPVVSARTNGFEPPKETPEENPDETGDSDTDKETEPRTRKAPTTTGGEGQVTLALRPSDARRVIEADFAGTVVHSRGKQREYEAIGVLKQRGNQFRKVTVTEASPLAGSTIAALQVRDAYGVAILAIRRGTERLIAPRGSTELHAGDVLVVVGKRDGLKRFEEVAK